MRKKKIDPFIELSEIEPKEVEWLFEPFIPLSMLSIIEGDPKETGLFELN